MSDIPRHNSDVYAQEDQIRLMDRKTWEHEAQAEFVRAQYNGEDVTVVMVDLNGAKDVNDEVGHAEGDELMDSTNKMMANITSSFHGAEVKPGVRSYDLVSISHYQPTFAELEDFPDLQNAFGEIVKAKASRFGGDEWVVFCRGDEQVAKTIVERIRAEFAEILGREGNEHLLEQGVGIAVGSATTNDEVKTFKELMAQADRNMHQDKFDQLGLTEHQKRVIIDSFHILAAAGIRYRDAARFIRSHHH